MQSSGRGSQEVTPFLPSARSVKERAWSPTFSQIVLVQTLFLLLFSLLTWLNLVSCNNKGIFIVGKLEKTMSLDLWLNFRQTLRSKEPMLDFMSSS